MGKKLVSLLACAFVLSMFGACNEVSSISDIVNGVDDGTSTSDTADTVADIISTENSGTHEDSADYSWDSSQIVKIVLNGDSITANSTAVSINASKATITSAGTYSISGSLTNGQIVVDTQDEEMVRLILNGVNITCTTSAPIYVANAGKAMIVLAANTKNYVTDGNSYAFEDPQVEEPNAAIFAKSDFTIYGDGSLTVVGNYNDGIAGKDGLIIKSGTIAVNAKDDGIRGKDYLVVEGGDLSVTAMGNGLKSDNAEDTARGYISIEAGNINVASDGDAITAQTDTLIAGGTISLTSGGGSSKSVSGDVSAKGIKGCVSVVIDGGTLSVNSADDAIHSNNKVIINNGTFAIASRDDAVHADTSIVLNGGTLGVTKCYEGIESPSITVNSGNITIVSSDDGFNTTNGNGGEANDGSCLYINGGNIAVTTSAGDGLDSNGNIVMTSGTVIVNGPSSQPEVALDFNGTFQISGGTLIATGPNSGNMIQAPNASSTQYCVKAMSSSGLAASTLFHIQDSGGNNVVTFKPVRNAYYVVFSSPDLKSGSTYSIYTGGSSTGTNINGLYSGGTYSGGTQKKSFTISNIITSVSF